MDIKKIIKESLVKVLKEGKLPKRFTVKTKQKIGDTLYNPGTYALKKKRYGGGIYLNMDNNQMLGVDEGDIKKLTEDEVTENIKQGYVVVYRDKAYDKTYTAQIPPGISKAEIVKMLKKTIRVGLEIIGIEPLKESVNEVSALGASKAMRIGRKLGWEAKKRSSGRTDYVTFTKDGKEYGPVDANVLTKDYLIKKLSETLNEGDIKKFKKNLDAMVASYVKDGLKLDKEEERKAFVELKKLIKNYSFSKMRKLRGEGINEASDVWKIFDAKQKLYSQAIDMEDDLRSIAMDVKQTRIDMEQEAEPEGGKVADRYGKELNKLEKAYDKKKKELKKILAKIEKMEMM